ncbi:MAG: phosphate acyltransferase PlsX [Chloroflexi bacterium]|nr:phosphate acyltransferase PlsX [Chloroflexota bacterium]|tara:strand:- start:20200 stop:21204 length:1005 start_codon:yes stop_codon:yes gene_type:complete
MSKYTIAIDAMGGDDVPRIPVEAGVIAAKEYGVGIILVGDENAINNELSKFKTDSLEVRVVHAEDVIAEGEHPALALRRKPGSSIMLTVGLVKAGTAHAAISMGSTGATMAASVFALGLFDGLERPTLGGPFIGLAPKTTIIDLGANVDCKPSQLVNFGALGASFERFYHKMEDPRVGLLSVGSEDGKGNKQVQEAFPLFQSSGLNFVGNIEPHEIFAGKADVVVCDGFVGNVLLKYTEGLAAAAGHFLASKLGNDSPAVSAIAGLAGAAEGGGGPLFGINGVVIAGHGRSSANSIAGSVLLAKQVMDANFVETMREDLARVMARTREDSNGKP